jgi:hypothetical protein
MRSNKNIHNFYAARRNFHNWKNFSGNEADINLPGGNEFLRGAEEDWFRIKTNKNKMFLKKSSIFYDGKYCAARWEGNECFGGT